LENEMSANDCWANKYIRIVIGIRNNAAITVRRAPIENLALSKFNMALRSRLHSRNQ
jgi:hypothetical protein